MTARLCHTEIVPTGHKKAGRKNLIIIVCQKYLLVAIPLSGANRLSRKKEKKKNILLSKTGNIWWRFFSEKNSIFTLGLCQPEPQSISLIKTP